MSRPRSAAGRIARAIPPVRRLIEERDAARAKAGEVRRKVRRLRAREARLRDRLELAEKRAVSSARAVEQLKGELAVYRDVPRSAEQQSYDYVFVMAFQRSGSTLLQVILNSIPGFLIRGENGALTKELYAFHRRAQEQKRVRGDWANEPGFPFFGINDYPEDVALTEIRNLVVSTLLRPVPGATTLGFKEVNWWVDDIDDYLDFFREVFPGARFIANTRRIEDAAKSRWFANQDDSVEVLTDRRDRILNAVERLGDDAFHLRYDDYVNDHERLRPLFDWLGAPFDLETIDKVMATRYAV